MQSRATSVRDKRPGYAPLQARSGKNVGEFSRNQYIPMYMNNKPVHAVRQILPNAHAPGSPIRFRGRLINDRKGGGGVNIKMWAQNLLKGQEKNLRHPNQERRAPLMRQLTKLPAFSPQDLGREIDPC